MGLEYIMGKIKSILAIDVGAVSLKIAEFSYSVSGEMVLEKYAYIEYDQENVDNKNHLKLLEDAFFAAVEKNNFTAKHVYLSISGQSTFIRFTKLPPTSHKKEKVQQLVAYEAKQNVPYPIEEVTWSYQLFDNKVGELDEINVMFAVVKSTVVKEIVNIIEKKKFVVKLVDISPTTCFNTARANKMGEDDCVMILNIGGTCSTLVFVDKGKFYARTIPIAGQTVTQQISRKLDVSLKKADEMKRQIGFVALRGTGDEPESEDADEISKIIKNVLTRLYGDINRSLNVYKSQQQGNAPTKLYLAGGGSIINFTSHFLAVKLKIPVEYFNPLKIIKLADSINKEELANLGHTTIEVIGLGLRNATTCPIEISLLPEELIQQQNFKIKRFYFLAAACIVIFCLCLVLWGVSNQNKLVTNLINSTKKQTLATEKRLSTMKSFLKKLKGAKKKFVATTDYLKERNTWVDILNTIQQCLPDNTWIVELALEKDTPMVRTKQKRRSLFGKTKVVKGVKKQSGQSQSKEWLVIKAHSLVLSKFKKISSAEKFKNNLLGSKIFSDNSDNVIITDFKTDPNESNNIDTFHMKIKLQ